MASVYRTKTHPRLTALAAAVGLALSGPLFAADALIGLGTLGGTNSYGQGISADGSAVVGYGSTSSDAASHAFRLTGSTMADLGTLGSGRDSQAFGVSADGSVVVGQSRYAAGNSAVHAFRWVATAGGGGTMSDLGTLGGADSIAYGVSGDGVVVVGYSYINGAVNHAFRWVATAGGGGTMTDLGTLGGTYSYANAASSDGSVVVGNSYIAGNTANNPFRWTTAAGPNGGGTMTDLGTLGGTGGGASGVSADGSVVVGYSSKADGATHAFRWTTAAGPNGGGTMADLGTLSGKTSSDARAVSADGEVVVGSSYMTDPNNGNTSQRQAFRWTQATNNMQAVTAWLTGAGVAVGGWTLEKATGVNTDGTVVVGTTTNVAGNQEAWLARVGGAGTGLITNPVAYQESLAQAGTGTGWVVMSPMFGMVSGGHHRSLLDNGLARKDAAGTCAWATADAGRQDNSGTRMEMAEVGACKDIGSTRLGLGVGQVQARQDWSLNGSARLDGQYLIAEMDHAFENGLEGSVLGLYGRFNTQLNRHYMNGVAVDNSSASPNAHSSALRLRLDWKNVAQFAAFSLSPYVAYTWLETKVDAYTETGGGFPAAFDASTSHSNGSRIGVAGKTALSPATDLKLSLEAVHSFESNGSGVSGQAVGLPSLSFSLPGRALKQDWVRAIVDLDHRLSSTSVVTLSANGASTGGDASWGVSVGYRAAF